MKIERLLTFTGLMVFAVAALATSSAFAQGRIVITEFENDADGELRDLIIEELLMRDDYDIVDVRDFNEEVEMTDATILEVLDDPELLRSVAEYLEAQVIIHGEADRRRRASELFITVYEGASGATIGDVVVELDRGEPDFDSLDWGLADIESYIFLAEELGAPPIEEEPDEPDPPREPREPVVDPGPAGDDAPWFRVHAGLDFTQRSFTLASAEAGIQYDSGFKPGIEGVVEVYPVALISPGIVDGLGLRIRVARYFVDTLLMLDDSLSLDIPTRHKELGLSLLYRHNLGPVEFVGQLGLESLAFVLGANDIYQSSEYDAFAIGVGAYYTVVADLLRIGAMVDVRPAPALGDAELVAFGSGSSFGFGFSGGIEVVVFDPLQIIGQYEFQRFSNSYDGTGTSELEGAIEATDTFHQMGIQLGIAY